MWYIDIDNLPAGAGTLRIDWVSGTVKLCGVNLKSSAPGVRVNKLAATGSSISSWANAPAAQFEAAQAVAQVSLATTEKGYVSESNKTVNHNTPVATVKTKQGNTRVTNKPIDDNTPVATVNLPGVEVVAKRYVANIGGKEYWFSSEEKKNAFVDKVNRAINYSLTNKKYGYDPKKNWYRTKIG
jgi:YHS domain-containing protein